MEKHDILIVGGGASGLAAAISAKMAGVKQAAVIERQNRVGKKLLATGNGRCNILNRFASVDAFHGNKALMKPALNAFTYNDALDFFSRIGIEIRESENGCCYPMSNQASAVLDCLRLRNAELGNGEITEFDVKAIERTKGGFCLVSQDGSKLFSRRVIVAVGSMAQPKLGGGSFLKTLLQPLGHTFTPCYPALTQIKTGEEHVSGLKGQKYQGNIRLMDGEKEIACENGEILFTENGVSGIAAMQLTLYASERLNKGRKLSLILSPLSLDLREAESFLTKRAKMFPHRSLEDFFTGVIPKRIGMLAFRRAGLQPLAREAGSLSAKEISVLARECTLWRVPVAGCGGFDSAQVMLGGARGDEFNPETLESRRVPGLYCAGEMLDVTGPCGGYNLTWAWASGILAGRSAAKSL
ncbi:MAG: aminoacetone oxidase family FAD-binding enzyme [Clostridia bacterium]|nr:aminoacetone oxidase family FAD-binding enzyme [Clostridia bacterium]